MHIRGSTDRFLSINDTAERRARSEGLVAEIAAALSSAGEHVARIDLQPTQDVVDFNWAARRAGRRLGLRVALTSRVLAADGQLEIHVRALTSR